MSTPSNDPAQPRDHSEAGYVPESAEAVKAAAYEPVADGKIPDDDLEEMTTYRPVEDDDRPGGD